MFFPFAMFFFMANGQGNGDCENALEITDVQATIGAVEGFGSILEFSGNQLGNNMYFTDEHNSVWLSFKARYDGELSFDITPRNPKDDWDFILFRAGKDQCKDIADKKIKPVRSNLARNNEAAGGVTGLRPGSQHEFVAAGINPNFSKPITVEENQAFILCVDIHDPNQNGFVFRRKSSIKNQTS